MSKQTIEWLNTNVLVGCADVRGNAWHYRKSAQGAESNHYPGFIPEGDVVRRLFNFDAVEAPLSVSLPADIESCTGIDADGNMVRTVSVPGRKAVVASDTGHVFGLFADGYTIHNFRPWLLDNVSHLIGGELGISSAGLLSDRGIAWVEVSVPETLSTRHGIDYRPNLLACTSHTGKLASTFKRTITNTVCDNTMGAALGERGQQVKIRHSRYSGTRVEDARAALALIHQAADTFDAGVSALVEKKVSDLQFKTVLRHMVPVNTADSKRTQDSARRRQAEITRVYLHDPRVGDFTGTAYGVVQAFNTWEHHGRNVHGTDKNAARAERNMLSALTGDTDKADAAVLAALAAV